MKDWLKADKKYVWHPFTSLQAPEPLLVKSASGPYLFTEDGRAILDMVSSWWVNIHGHAHPKIAKAIAKQALKLEQVIFAGFTHKPAIKLSASLLALLPPTMSRVFFSDDGSTSVEVAIKLALQYWHNMGSPRKKVIAIEGAYHGDTFGAMAVGERGMFTAPFDALMFDVTFIPFPHGNGAQAIKAMKKLANEEVAAFIFEPLVQGAGGMRMYKPDVLDKLILLAKEKGIVCIADEVMTGFGRTGRLFASDHLAQVPDVFCLSKGITGGFLPMGVTVMSKEIAQAFDDASSSRTFFHGHSYTANPLACAAALASMKILLKESTQKSIQRIVYQHEAFALEIKDHPALTDVRQTGTILAMTFKAKDEGYASSVRDRLYHHFLSRNILLRPLGNVLYIMPPYIITPEQLQHVYQEIRLLLAEW